MTTFNQFTWPGGAMTKVGIFWVHKNTVIGKSVDASAGHENVPGIIDSPDNHVDHWEQDPSFINPFPELRGTPYQATPRGRVLFDTNRARHIVYLGSELLNAESKKRIAEFFEIDLSSVDWRIDLHYTTNAEEIDMLLGGSNE